MKEKDNLLAKKRKERKREHQKKKVMRKSLHKMD